jgi:uncharacterized protein (TIGR03435 family)
MAKANPCREICVAVSAACILYAVQALPAQENPSRDAPATQAQDAAPQLLAFDVVSVKPHKDEGIGHMNADIWMTPDGITISGTPLSMLIREAFGVPEDRILNDPAWAETSRYDIQAKVGADDVTKLKTLSPQQRWEMLLPVFEDRFGLRFHHRTVELRVYALTVAKEGARIKASKPARPGEDEQPQFGIHGTARGKTMECHGASMANLARTISEQLGTTVVDKTELTGKYDFTLIWLPDEDAGPTMTGLAPMTMRMPATGVPSDSNTPREGLGPSLFTAIREQLGLKLESQKEPVDVIVVDHIEQPSPN